MMRTAALLSGITALTALAGCMTPSGPQFIGPMSVVPDAVFNIVGTQDLTPETARELAEFRRENEAYGAFYVSPDGAIYAWRVGTFQLANAEHESFVACSTLAGVRCSLYATINPSDPTLITAIPQRAVGDITDAYNRTQPGNYAAVYTMPIGAYGYSYNYPTPAEAQAAARAECESERASERAALAPELRDAYEDSGLFTCRNYNTYSVLPVAQ